MHNGSSQHQNLHSLSSGAQSNGDRFAFLSSEGVSVHGPGAPGPFNADKVTYSGTNDSIQFLKYVAAADSSRRQTMNSLSNHAALNNGMHKAHDQSVSTNSRPTPVGSNAHIYVEPLDSS